MQLSGAVGAVHIHSSTVFSWFGKRSPRLLPRIEREITPRTARSFLQYTLQSRLYSHFYCAGSAIPVREGEGAGKLGGQAPYVERLSEANSGQGYWADGWEEVDLEGLGPGLVAAGRAGLLLVAGEGSYRRKGEGGRGLLLRFGKELPAVSPGFYMAVGNLDLDAPDDGSQESGGELVRFYWHVTPEGAAGLMRLCTEALNRAKVPFRLKVLNDPERYERCDAGVLYIRRGHYRRVASLLEEIYPSLYGEMQRVVPAFTLMLAPGLGLAEDPGDGDSFGLHRCGLVADGLIRAYEEGAHSIEDRLRAVVDRFNEAGISLEQPYLGAGSEGNYTFQFDEGRIAKSVGERRGVGGKRAGIGEIARSGSGINSNESTIADQLVADAVWYEGMCNWLGTEVLYERKGTEISGRREEWSTLGPDLYTGTAGVGLFLAEYAALTGDEEARRSALGAFRHAYYKAEAFKPAARPGLYTGWLGIALGAGRAGLLLGEAEMLEAGIEIARRCASEDHPGHEYDLLTGSAGGIVGCLALMSVTGAPFLLDYAVRLGEELVASARVHKRSGALSWPSVGSKVAAPLTGFSHGAAGIGYALLELWDATGDGQYREAALGAFRYEEGWLNCRLGNWPDFRETGPSRGRGREGDALVYMTYWCHGAPGIALSRLRAYELTGEEARREEARIAIGTTEHAVRSDLAMRGSNYSLCHGLAGNATILGHAALGGVMGDGERAALGSLAQEVGEEGTRRYKANGWWACGTGGRPNAQAPGLMLGVAGIGHFYLRLAHPQVPSVLLVEPKAWGRVP